MNATKLHTLSRETLYEKVWSTSSVKLAQELEVSDVAINKRCRRLNVPKPPRGYWTKIEAGHEPKRQPLPPFMTVAGSDETKRFAERRADLDAAHPLADEFLKALQITALCYDKLRVQVTARAVPEALISKELAPHAAKVFNLLLQKTESHGVQFSRSLSKYDGGQFRLGNDRLKFKMEEELADKPVESTKRRRSYSSFTYANKVPCGKPTLTLKSDSYNGPRVDRRWQEDEKTPLETMLAEIAKFIWDHFAELENRRQEELVKQEQQRVENEIHWKKQREEAEQRRQQEARRKHSESVEAAPQHRKDDLVKAAEWWRLYQSTIGFIEECERRWRAHAVGQLTQEQHAWLAWAREEAKALSPFEVGYPEAAKDGILDPAAFPYGGPLPATRMFPQPPTMPQILAPVVAQQSYNSSYQPPPPKPYPFWLRHSRI